jgi:hypothetical protein
LSAALAQTVHAVAAAPGSVAAFDDLACGPATRRQQPIVADDATAICGASHGAIGPA